MKRNLKLLSLLCVPFMLVGCAEGGSEDNTTNPDNTNTGGDNNNSGNSGTNNDNPPAPHTHVWDEAWSKSAAQHWHKCTEKNNGKNCTEKKDAADHDFNEWVIDSYAKDVTVNSQWGGSQTQKQNGTKHRVCKICEYNQTDAVEEYDPSIFDARNVPEPTEKYASKYERDYNFFDTGAPVIKFTVTNDPKGGTSTNFATQPRKSSNIDPWEVTGKFIVDNIGDNIDFEIGEVTGAMKVRGNFTTDYTKKGFRIKFVSKQNLFGLNNGKQFKKWVLFADVKDNSMLRNAMAFYLGDKITGENVFTTDFTPVHLYLNNQYWGLYLLGEQKENKEGRINLPELPVVDRVEKVYTGTDIGYCFELDKYATEEAKKEDGDPTFTVNYSPSLTYSPHSGENRYECNGFTNTYTMLTDLSASDNSAQLAFIKKRVESTYKVIYNATKANKLTEIVNEDVVNSTETDVEACLAKTIDIDSFVDMYIMNEIVCDPDIGYSSFYLSFDNSATGDKKLRLDCPWDFDSTMGVRANTVEDSQGMYASKSSNVWLSMLSNTTWFKNRVKAKWNQLREAEVFEKAMNMIEDFSINYYSDYKKNFQKWPGNMGNNSETAHELRNICKQLKHERQAEQLLYHWFADRIDYLETVFGNNRESILPGGGVISGGGDVTDDSPVDYSEFKAASNKTRIEAETGTLSGNCKVKTRTGEGISGDSYVGDLNPNGGSVTFTYNAAKAGDALLTVGLSGRSGTDYKLTDLFDITVNGTPVSSNVVVPQGANDFHAWTEVDAAKITLTSGNNTIVFTAKQNSTNFDYIDLYTAK